MEMLYQDIDDKDVTHRITDIPDEYKISNTEWYLLSQLFNLITTT